ncbi:MAG: hypothetical protein Q9185_007113 [Variospora sp. 1 TL-2023]
MSRHKLIKSMDLDDELDDFDGVNYDDDFDASDELTADDKVRLREGVAQVRAVLGPSISLNDKDIEDSLWHYYYDVDKTINYLLLQQAPAQSKASKKKDRDATNAISKAHRQGEILIEPLYPRGGLLGGSSTQGGPKVSKLAALAAARKKKANEKSDVVDPQQPNPSVALLERLKNKDTPSETEAANGSVVDKDANSIPPKETPQTRRYLSRRAKGPHKEVSDSDVVKATSPATGATEDPVEIPSAAILPTASPSTFARIMMGSLQDSETSLIESLQNVSLSLPRSIDANTKIDPFAGPSPDDVVTKAQTSSKGPKPAKKTILTAKENKETIDLAEGIAEVAFDEGPRMKSKNLDVLAEFQKSRTKHAANFVVIGHVDAGKSTLMGRLLYDMQVVDQRTIDRYRKEAERIGKASFALAWVLDQGTEERNRGVTIDIAMNKFETENTSFTILDAPGHRDFIPNMIAGASQADFAVLVIDASIGSFESGLRGQTKEHALLVRSMGVQRIVVAINKLDTVQWSQDRFDEIRQQISAFLTTAGFLAKNIVFVPCSGLTGDNIARQADDHQSSWYTGPILLEALEGSGPTNRALDKPLRITVADIFRGGVQNPLSISGRLESGSLQVGDRVVAMPASETATIKGIEVDSEPTDWAVSGQNVVLHLTDIQQKYLKPGDVVCSPSAPIQNNTTFTVKILAFDHVTPMHVELHRGRLHVPGRITQLVAVLDKGTGAVTGKKKAKLVQPGAVARVVVEVETPVPLEAPGRVVLRAGGETVAAGLLE